MVKVLSKFAALRWFLSNGYMLGDKFDIFVLCFGKLQLHITCPVVLIHFFGALKSQFDTFFWSRLGLGLQFQMLVLDLNFVQNIVELLQFL